MSQDCIDSAAVGNPEEFPCYFPQKRHMCREEDRMETFHNSWCDQKCPTAQELVNAGFYYKKYGDRVCCFYCGGLDRNENLQAHLDVYYFINKIQYNQRCDN